MTLPFKTFRYRGSDTPPAMRCRLRSRNVRSGAVRLRPGPGDLVEWTVSWPGGTVTKTSAANGGLKVDPRSRVVAFPVLAADLAPLAVGAQVPLVVRLLNGAGERRTWFYGDLVKDGDQP